MTDPDEEWLNATIKDIAMDLAMGEPTDAENTYNVLGRLLAFIDTRIGPDSE